MITVGCAGGIVAVMVGSCQPQDADRNHQGYRRGAGNCDLWVAAG